MGRVSGKVAIVTGGARGMGESHARRLVEEGAKVVLTDVLVDEGEAVARELGCNAHFMRHDVTSEAQWKQIISDSENIFGPVSILVNNAGIASWGPLETLEETDFRDVIDINLVSVFLGMKSVVPSMKNAGGGSIINISSVSGIVGTPLTLAYTASKFAVRGMTKTAAIELASYSIRVNSIHPGFIRTPMAVPTPESEELLAGVIDATPAHRMGEPEEVSNIVVMLASDETQFSTGAEFVVDGGLSCQ